MKLANKKEFQQADQDSFDFRFKPHRHSNLKASHYLTQEEILERVLRCPAEDQGIAYEILVKANHNGRDIPDLINFARINRIREENGFLKSVSLDEIVDENKDTSLLDVIAGPDTNEVLSEKLDLEVLIEGLDPALKQFLAIIESSDISTAGQLIKSSTCRKNSANRKGQRYLKAIVEKLAGETSFKEGRKGQGGLFDLVDDAVGVA